MFIAFTPAQLSAGATATWNCNACKDANVIPTNQIPIRAFAARTPAEVVRASRVQVPAGRQRKIPSGSGAFFSRYAVVDASPEVMTQEFAAAVAGLKGCTINPAGANTLHVVRVCTPSWALLLGWIGMFFAFIGLVFFLVKQQELLTITLVPSGRGTAVTMSGTAAPAIQTQLIAVLSRHGALVH